MALVALTNLQQVPAVNFSSDQGAIGGPVVIPQCAQIVLKWSTDSGKGASNVLYGRYAGSFAGSVAQATAIMTGLNTGAAWTALAAFFSTTTLIGPVLIRDVNSANQGIIQSAASGSFGTSASPALPNEVAAVITLRTAFTGRGNRGRIFVPGWATNALSANNVISAAAVTALQNWANTIPSVFAANGYTFVLGQKQRQAYTGKTGTQHPARLATSTPITSQPVRDNHWDSQRRRGLK